MATDATLRGEDDVGLANDQTQSIQRQPIYDMRALRVIRALIVAIALVTASLVGPASASAYYYTSCGGYLGTNHDVIWHPYRNTSGPYYGAKSTTTIRSLHACTGGSTGYSAVMAANLQNTGCAPFVQLGYGELTGGAGLTWLFTPDDRSCGHVTQLSFAGCNPVVGQTVTFTIDQPNSSQWRYSVSVSGGCGATITESNHYSGSGAVEAWWGIEAHDRNDQFGGQGGTYTADLSPLQYQKGRGSVWSTATNDTVGYWAGDPHPSYWHGGATDPIGYVDHLFAYTDNR
jgi:hypothetical protein